MHNLDIHNNQNITNTVAKTDKFAKPNDKKRLTNEEIVPKHINGPNKKLNHQLQQPPSRKVFTNNK